MGKKIVSDQGVPIIDFPGYTVNSSGQVFKDGKLRSIVRKRGQGWKVIIMRNRKNHHLSIAHLVAKHFIPNPKNSRRVEFIDGNNHHYYVQNLRWLVKTAHPRVKKSKLDRFSHDYPGIPIEGYPGYTITEDGKIFRFGKPRRIDKKKNIAFKVRIKQDHKTVTRGLAKLIAEHFIPNPRNHKNIIFKDWDYTNCKVDNIAWVSGDVFLEWAMGRKWREGGRKKLLFDRHEAIQKAEDIYLKKYYQTLDEYWLHECWNHVEAEFSKFHFWRSVKSECYLYFLDRAKRFSILRRVGALVWLYSKGVRVKIKKEISPDIPLRKLITIDESLRKIKNVSNYD